MPIRTQMLAVSRKRVCAIALAAVVLFSAQQGYGADYFWNPNLSGNWVSNNWSTPADGPTYASAWSDSNTANFTAASRTISVNSLITIAGINFTADGIVLASGSGDLRLVGSVPLSVSGTNTATITEDVISIGAGVALVKQGTGTLVLSGNNNLSTVTVSAGTLKLGSSGAMGSAALTPALNVAGTLDLAGFSASRGNLSGAGTVTNSAAAASVLTIGSGSTTATTTFSGQIQDGAGTMSLTMVGTGTLALTGSNSYTGATRINGGTLRVSSLGNGGANSGIGASTSAAENLQFGGGTLEYNGAGSAVTNRAFTLNAGGGTINVSANASTTLVISGSGTGTGGLTKTGVGILTLTGANTYAGGTTVSAGVLRLGNGLTNGSVTGNVVNNATLQLNNPASSTISGNITGTGALSIVGAGTQTFTGTNTYTGSTTLTGAAKVQVAAGARLAANGAAGVTVGALTTLGGEGTIGGASVTYQSAASLEVGNGTPNDIGILTFANNLSLQSGSKAFFQFDRSAGDVAGTGYDQVIAGDITLDGQFMPLVVNNSGTNQFTTMSLFSGTSRTGFFSNLAQGQSVPELDGFAGSDWIIDYTATGVNLVAVPEPASIGMMALVSLTALCRRNRRSRA